MKQHNNSNLQRSDQLKSGVRPENADLFDKLKNCASSGSTVWSTGRLQRPLLAQLGLWEPFGVTQEVKHLIQVPR